MSSLSDTGRDELLHIQSVTAAPAADSRSKLASTTGRCTYKGRGGEQFPSQHSSHTMSCSDCPYFLDFFPNISGFNKSKDKRKQVVEVILIKIML